MDTRYLTRRTLELKEWWLLRKNDPAAIERQQQREAIAARADADNRAWLADGQIGTAPPSSGPVGPPPRGPQVKEVIAVGAVGFVVVLILAAIGSMIDTPKPASVAAVPTVSALPTVTMTTPTKATAAADLPAVPVGQHQTIEGEYDGTKYKAKVTVTAVTRTTDTTVVIKAKVDVLEGKLPIDGGWSATTTTGKTLDGREVGDTAFGELVDGKVTGESELFAGEAVKIKDIRLQPRHQPYATKSLNETAVWSVDAITTSLTTTEPEPAPEPTTTEPGTGGGGSTVDVPNVDVPNVNVPNGCINGRDRRGRFC